MYDSGFVHKGQRHGSKLSVPGSGLSVLGLRVQGLGNKTCRLRIRIPGVANACFRVSVLGIGGTQWRLNELGGSHGLLYDHAQSSLRSLCSMAVGLCVSA